MSAFDDLIKEGESAGISAEFLERVKAATDASPLRAENKALKEKTEADAAALAKYRAAATSAGLKAAGIAVDASAFNLPADLDMGDVEAVKAWGVTVGLVAKVEAPATSAQDKAALDALGKPVEGTPVNREAADRAGVQSFTDLVDVARNTGYVDTGGAANPWRR